METKDFRLRFIELLCWAFFVLCAIAIARWVVLKVVTWAVWGTPDWAAWVQAVGSIGAIFGAYHLAEKTHERSRQVQALEKLKEDARKLTIARSILWQAQQIAQRLLAAIEDNIKSRVLSITQEQLERQRNLINAIDFMDIPSANAAQFTLILEVSLNILIDVYKEPAVIASQTSDHRYEALLHEHLEKRVELVCKQLALAIEQFDMAINETEARISNHKYNC